jgi:hypothetical protein
MYDNFAFVNAVAMERQLNCKAMMLHQFTWQQFLVAAAVLTLVWYGLWFVFWNLKGKGAARAGSSGNGGHAAGAEKLPHHWERGVDVLSDDNLMGVAQEPEGLSRVGMDQFSFAPHEEIPKVTERPAADSSSFLQRTVADFLEELKLVFDYAARYKKGQPAFLEHLQALLGRYPEIRQSPNWPDIVAHISELAREQLPFSVSAREIHDFPEQQVGDEFDPEGD